jgi:hypothetical protein
MARRCDRISVVSNIKYLVSKKKLRVKKITNCKIFYTSGKMDTIYVEFEGVP